MIGRSYRQLIVDCALQTTEQDNEAFLQKFQARIKQWASQRQWSEGKEWRTSRDKPDDEELPWTAPLCHGCAYSKVVLGYCLDFAKVLHTALDPQQSGKLAGALCFKNGLLEIKVWNSGLGYELKWFFSYLQARTSLQRRCSTPFADSFDCMLFKLHLDVLTHHQVWAEDAGISSSSKAWQLLCSDQRSYFTGLVWSFQQWRSGFRTSQLMPASMLVLIHISSQPNSLSNMLLPVKI